VDTDEDGLPDVGVLLPTQTANIVVNVTIGWNTTLDVTTVTGASTVNPTVDDSATDTTTGVATITITLGSSSAQFGTNLDPDGAVSDSADTVIALPGTAGNAGVYYAWLAQGAGVNVTVRSNQSWVAPSSRLRMPELRRRSPFHREH
jgi:hypothetical protein